MKKFKVEMAIPVFLTITVEADNEEDAKDKAFDYASLEKYCGNGGMDKLVGVNDECVSIYSGESVLEGEHQFDVDVIPD